MEPSRRTVLSGGILGLAAACTSGARVAAPRVPTRDDLLRQQAAVREEALLRMYNAALAAFPVLAPELGPLRDHHVQHRAALGATVAVTETAAPALLGTTAAEARTRIAALEKGTSQLHAKAALMAGRELAPLLASLAACESSHAELL